MDKLRGGKQPDLPPPTMIKFLSYDCCYRLYAAADTVSSPK